MLSKRTKYGLKALAFLARTDRNVPVQTNVIAEAENISVKFLESILQSLRTSGYLGAKKGKGGGFYLIMDPEKIPLADIIRQLEGPIALLPCVSLNYYEPCTDCKSEETCTIHLILLKVRDSMLDVFTNHSLADLS